MMQEDGAYDEHASETDGFCEDSMWHHVANLMERHGNLMAAAQCRAMASFKDRRMVSLPVSTERRKRPRGRRATDL